MCAQDFAAEPRAQPTARSHRISGRVINSHGLVPSDVQLLIGTEVGESSFESYPVVLTRDGSFVTRPLVPATYVLDVQPLARSNTTGARAEGGLSVVTLGSSDLAGVLLRTRPGFSVAGQFRMESDNLSAAWPPTIFVQGFLALDGSGMGLSSGAEGARPEHLSFATFMGRGS